MHLKTLTLRGFKSFTSSTTLHFEPGITCVVGPNGSGKSNVVDALAWVMGEQGAKTLRGGKMEDVIFAGTAGRPPLGRAEVVLTIDNTDGALPIEFTEVTISRTMFRNGGSEYAINGHSCRLLDVQELLSDSGIGREMHVIVGQGQLDHILAATPEDRRGFVEEAAGVLKHRKRKEKALRKVEATQANLTRLQDLTAELRRQLKPLGRQAEVARRAQGVQADLRDARLRLLADDLVQLTSALEQDVADESALRARQAEVAAGLAAARANDATLDAAVAAESPRMTRAQETWYRLSSLRERLRGTASLSAERTRHLSSEPEESRGGRDPDELEAEALRVRSQERVLTESVQEARRALDVALAGRKDAEAAATAAEGRFAELLRAAADRRAGLARLTERIEGLRNKTQSADADIARLRQARSAALSRAAEAQREFTALENTIAGLSAGEAGLDAQHEAAAAELAEIESDLERLRDDDRAAERERAALVARRDALEIGLSRRDGAAALLAADDRLDGVMGSVPALLQVEPGWEAAVAVALGRTADAVALASVDDALVALQLLKADDLGRAAVLIGGAAGDEGLDDKLQLPSGMHYAVDLVAAPVELRPALRRLLDDVVAVDDLPSAVALVSELPTIVAVTRDGELLSRDTAFGGSTSAQSLLEVQAAFDEANDRLAAAKQHGERLRERLSARQAQRAAAAERVQLALARLYESDAELSAVAERLSQLGQLARAAGAEADRTGAAVAETEASRDRDFAALADLESRLAAVTTGDESADEPSEAERDATAAAARQARQVETEARLALRTGEERVRALSGRADGLERAARQERETRARTLARRERRAREAAVVTAVGVAVDRTLDRLEASLAAAAEERTAAEQRRQELEARLAEVRGEVRRLGTELDELTSVVHRDEMARTELRMRIEQLQAKALEEYGVDSESLVGEYGPQLPVPPSPPASASPADPEPQPAPYVRAEQEKRARAAERALALLGKINPLALEEFAALEERHRFLTEQLEDLKRTRKDLLDIVREVDERVEQVFTDAYHDVAREFEAVFARLFPGGDGRLLLTEPADMLTTGIDVEARPPGKKVKRLSLLSGGERSLVAVAFLVALFKARPSPFYVLDEVEAALDDTNLGRLLEIYEELRETSQLVVITHQKRTMEIADALYGTTMRGDGVTTVISQRLREAESA